VAAALLALAGAAAAQTPAASLPGYSISAQTALQRGFEAYQAGRHRAAIGALTEAADLGDPMERFLATFYLARAYAEEVGDAAAHTRAFVLYRKLADDNLTVDPEMSRRAPFVAKALIAVARYVRDGIPEIDLAPNPRRANDYLHHAAVFFGDREAQFELARIYLGSGDNTDDAKRGLHYLSALTEASYAPAQALLADLYWRGQHVKKDDRRALALVTMAVGAAPSHERIWIEDTYATIYCAAAPATRDAAGDLAARWGKTFARPAPEPVGVSVRDQVPERQCASGERVAIAPPSHRPAGRVSPAPAPARTGALTVSGPAAGLGLLKSGPVPPANYRAAGIVETAVKK
jgi:hypothetical protein